MKIKFKYLKSKGCFQSGYYKGNGGVNSLIVSYCGSFWHCVKGLFRGVVHVIRH
jgi:hypothetical protein